MVRPGGRADGTFLDFLGIVAQVSDTPEEPEDGDAGPGEGGGSGPDEPECPAPRAGSIPTTGCGATPVRWPARARRRTSRRALNAPPRHNYRSAVMVLVGRGRRHGGGRLGHRPALPGVRAPARARPPQDTAANGPLTTLAGAQNALPAAAEAAGHSIVELQATTSHGTVLLDRRRRGRGRARRHDRRPAGRPAGTSTWSAPAASSQAASVVATDKASDVALVNVPEDLPVAPFADDTSLRRRGARPDPHLRAGGRHAVALHCTPGAVTAVGDGHRQRPRRRPCPPSPRRPPRRRVDCARRARCSTPTGRVLGILYDPDPGTVPGHLPPERPRRGRRRRPALPEPGGARLARGRRAPTPPTAAAPRWRRCSPAGPAAGRLQVGPADRRR